MKGKLPLKIAIYDDRIADIMFRYAGFEPGSKNIKDLVEEVKIYYLFPKDLSLYSYNKEKALEKGLRDLVYAGFNDKDIFTKVPQEIPDVDYHIFDGMCSADIKGCFEIIDKLSIPKERIIMVSCNDEVNRESMKREYRIKDPNENIEDILEKLL